jgi:cell division septum initiation protein DivIVA
VAVQPEVHVSQAFQEWLRQGEALYATALKEFRDIEARLDELEAALAAKQAEVNQIAQVIGKAPVESSRRPAATELASSRTVEDLGHAAAATPSSNATIARALTGKFGR